MKTKLEKLEGNDVVLEIEVDSDRVEQAMQKSYRKLVSQVRIPGFRQGKAPRQILEAFLGKEALYEEALEDMVPEAYEQAVKETEIEPISQPTIDLVQMEDGKPFIFKASVMVKPEVALGELTGMAVDVSRVEVDEAAVYAQLEMMRTRYAKLTPAEEGVPAESGDLLSIDFTGFLGDEPFPGGSGEDYSLELGSNTFIPGFEEQLIGVITGEEKDVNVTFPDDYHAEDLKSQEAVFKVKVKEIQKKEETPLDDDFARDVSDFDTLEELKADIRQNLEKTNEEENEGRIRQALVAKAVELSEVDVPEPMIENQMDVLFHRFEEQMYYQGVKMEDYVNMSGMTVEDIRASFRHQAERSVRENLVLETIAKKMELKVLDEDFDKQIEKAAAEFGMEAEAVRPSLEEARPRIEFGILLDKAVDYLKENATINIVDQVINEAAENIAEEEE
ncbi:MAG: trigger factor [Syntrophomonadaceae bacterium]|nr:trigger factor [Syntrophomonadaceae bacterium]